MFKATLATVLLASVSATQQQDTLKAAAAITQHAKRDFRNIQSAQASKATTAVNNFKLANKGSTLKATGVSKRVSKATIAPKVASVRTLRGKGGKGKGKNKGDDDEEEEEEEGSAFSYLQYSSGMCAGADMGYGALTEDTYLFHAQIKNGICYNVVGSDGSYHSYSMNFVAEPFSVFYKIYDMEDCQEANFIEDFDIMSDITFGGNVPGTGVCTDFEGYGHRLTVSGTSLAMPAGFVASADNSIPTECTGGDMSSYDYFELEAAGVMTPDGYGPMCEQEDDSDTPAPDSGSYEYDVSTCGSGALTVNMFSDNDCQVAVGSTTEASELCFFDVPYFAEEMAAESSAEFNIASQWCSPL